MATYLNSGTGNWSSNTSWNTCNSTAELDSVTGQNTFDTTTRDSATFTPGAITVDGVALRLTGTPNAGGTYTVTLRNSTDSVDVVSVSVSGTDLAGLTTSNTITDAEWVFFKFASQTLIAGKAYLIRTLGSTTPGSGLLIANNGTVNNHSRQLRTTANPAGAPVAGDKIIMAGELAGGGSVTTRTITLDGDQSSVSLGSTSFLQSIHVGLKGTLTFSTTSAANPKIKWKGLFGFFGGSTLNCGIVGTSIPSNSTAEFYMDSASNVDSGLAFNNLSTINIYGAPKTVVNTLMTADKIATNTVITLAATTDWANGDDLAFAPTSRSGAETEKKTISTVDSSTQVTLTAGLTNAHSGTSPTQAEVINLTRNIKIHGGTTILNGYVTVGATATVNIQYAEFYNLGSATALKRGIDVSTSTGTCIIQYCSFHDYTTASSIGVNILSTGSTTASTLVIANCVSYNIANNHISVSQNGTHLYTIRDCVCMRTNDAGANVITCTNSSFGASIGTFSNLTGIAGTSANGFFINAGGPSVSISGIVAHSNGGTGIVISHNTQLLSTANNIIILSNCKSWRNSGSGFSTGGNGISNLTFDNSTFFGNTTQNVATPSTARLRFTNCLFAGDSSFSTATGIATSSTTVSIECENCTFGTATGIYVAHTQDISLSNGTLFGFIFFRNCKLDSSTEISNLTTIATGTFAASTKHDQTSESYKYWLNSGTGTNDSVIYNTATPSLRMTPTLTGSKMESALPAPYKDGSYKVAVDSGTAPTVTVYVRKSVNTDPSGANYNGNQPRLIVRKNVALGITSDTVLATMSAAVGNWQQLSGTPSAPSENGVLEFIVDCDGTAGWVNVDDWSHTPVVDARPVKYFLDGLPYLAGGGSGGGSGISRGRTLLT